MRRIILLIATLFLTTLAYSQEAQLYIRTITLEGNKRTLDKIILRELDFQQGDSILQNSLTDRLERNRLQLINMGIFNKAEINIAKWEGQNLDLHILLKEDWFIYPVPIFELADRNFNVWWKEHNHALNRLNLGLRFYFDNPSGRNDRLKVVTQFGYTQKYELKYRLPYFNKKQSLGLTTNVLYATNREVAAQNLDNKLDFIRTDDEKSLKRFRAGFTLSYRPQLYTHHDWEANYYQNNISDTLVQANPEFFFNSLTRQQYLSLSYTFTLDKRDNKDYAQKGTYLQSSLKKSGLGWSKEVNDLSLSTTLAQYFSTKKWFGYDFLAKGKSALLRQKQPYYQIRRALGYEEDFIRGYEFYVIDGQNYAYFKNSLRFKLLDKAFHLKYMPLKALQYFPIKIFLKINGDIGYVWNEYHQAANSLENQLLYGGGPGLDIVLYHEYVLRLEYSFNRLGEKGLFLHYKFFF